MFNNVYERIVNSYSEDDTDDERHERWQKDQVFDNLLLKEKPKKNTRTCVDVKDPIRALMSPTIMIHNPEDEDINNIEIAQIESVYQRNLTPEGNVKYKNYKVLSPCNLPIRMYTPTGDIHTTPKKGKVMPKFELFDEFNIQREKMLELIEDKSPFNEILRSIIKPSDLKHKSIEAIRKMNVSSMDDYINFLNSANYSPSPPLSIFSDEKIATPPSSPESVVYVKRVIKSKSIDDDNLVRCRIKRQMSMPHRALNVSLSDELEQADASKSMSIFEYDYFHRPKSAFSMCTDKGSVPNESKKSILRSFVQRNMILQSENRDRLGKMALAIEEDAENDENHAFFNSAQLLEKRVQNMLDEIKELKDKLMEIQEDFQVNDRRVMSLLAEAKNLSVELEVLQYVDDIITLMNGGLHVNVFRNKWPFIFPGDELHERPQNLNLII